MINKLTKKIDKKNLKIIIPIIFIIVISIILIIYFKEYSYSRYRDKVNSKFYQYFSENKLEYEATVSFNKEKVIKEFKPKNLTINYETVPIYYSEETKVIFPSPMMIIFPIKKNTQYKILEFSYLEKSNNLYYLTMDKCHKNIDHFIIYDGEDQYFFSDSVEFTVNGQSITLSPMSYITAKEKEINYYDYETDTYNTYSFQNNIQNDIIISNEYYKVNLTNDSVEYYDTNLLLASNLDFLEVLPNE